MRKLWSRLVRGSRSTISASSKSSVTKAQRNREFLSKAKQHFDERYGRHRLCPSVAIGYLNFSGVIAESQLAKVVKAEYRWRIPSTDRSLAVKVYLKDKCVEQQMVSRILEEKKLLYATQHPFIIELLYTARDHENIYMMMEFAPYCSLSRLDDQRDHVVKHIAAQVILALEYLQTCMILHRNLAPENILLFKHGQIKLGDFTWACLVHESPATGLPGVQEYKAPECFFGGYGLPSDWWSFGVLLYNLSSGSFPYRPSRKDYSQREPFKFPKKPIIKSKLKDLIRKLLEYDTDLRLGQVTDGESNIRSHDWLKDVEWSKVYDRKKEVDFRLKGKIHHMALWAPSEPQPGTKDPHDYQFEDFGLVKW